MKKAILEVSFGTTCKEARERSILALERTFAEEFPEYTVFRAFTSGMIISSLKRQGISIDSVSEALSRLRAEGFDEVIVQSTHIIPGEEYDKVAEQTERFAGKFNVLKNGLPLLGSREDIERVCRIIAEEYPGETVVLMGHGTEHHANAVYRQLGEVSRQLGFDNIFIATVEAEPSLDDVLAELKLRNCRRVSTVPLMLVAGDHALNDMAGNDPQSWRSRLEAAGFEVNCVIKGLGEYPGIRGLYCEHLRKTIEGRNKK